MLHTEEIEIVVPDKIAENERLPLFLSIGPTLTMILPILLMTMVNMKFSDSNSSFVYMSLVTGGTGCLLGVVWGLVNHLYRRNNLNRRREKREEEYNRYLEHTERYLEKCALEDREFLCTRYPCVAEIEDERIDTYLWRRTKGDSDFGFLRLERGTIPSKMKLSCSEKKKEMFPDSDKERALKIINEFSMLKNAVRGIDFIRERFFGINIAKDSVGAMETIANLILSTALFVGSEEVKVCVLYDDSLERQKKLVSSIRMLPQLWDDGKRIRLLCGNEESVYLIASALEQGFSQKKHHYLIFVLSDKYIRNQILYKHLTDPNSTDSYSVFEVGESERLPGVFKHIIDEREYPRLERISLKRAERLAGILASKEKRMSRENVGIPQAVEFLDMNGINSCKQINILERWGESKPSKSLKALIGIGEGLSEVFLDIHEKNHGPHGLIAGTTGSGKSELIETYLLSLCMNYSPNDVNFFLIDYKGGGTGKNVKELPHCAGCISNLSGNEIGRSLKAIASENFRRQKMLKAAGVSHADDYGLLFKEGKVSEPMPHLILIIDEFAELKKEEPEFMRQIISLAAVGRSLGIHLILATQKPAGVVDDKIWSNSHFKLCLKVQDKQDSMDMLHRPDAAFLTNPGSCYMQIGNDEYFIGFQTAYCKSRYQEGEKTPKVYLLDEQGNRISSSDFTLNSRGRTVLETIVGMIIDEAKEAGIENARKLWMDELPSFISYEALNKKEEMLNFEGSRTERNEIRAENNRFFLLGMYDNPSAQRQGCICYAPSRHGYLCIGGGPASGKTQVLRTLADRIKKPNEFLLVDFRGEGLNDFGSEPNCLGLLDSRSSTEVFFYHLEKEIRRRKAGNNQNNLFIFIDGIKDFLSALNERKLEEFSRFLSEGIGCRIFFVITCLSIADIPATMFAKFQTTLALNMNDKFQYLDLMRNYRTDVFPRENTPGRCLFRVEDLILECQIALDSKKTSSRINEEREFSPSISSGRFFPFVPSNPQYIYMMERFKREQSEDKEKLILPIGFSLHTGYVRGVNLKEGGIFIISGSCESLCRRLMEQFRITMEDFCGLEKHRFILCDNPTEFVKKDENLEKLRDEQGIFAVFWVRNDKDTQLLMSDAGRMILSAKMGIHIGGGASNQRLLDFSDLGYSELGEKLPENCGFLRTNMSQKTIKIRIPCLEKEGEEDDYD